MVDKGGQVRIFISYSHKDVELRKELDAHLAILKRLEAIEAWHDGLILPGQEWENEIWNAFDAADLILLLISSDFIDSDFCYGKELGRALERHKSGTAYVVPVFIRACVWKGAPFETLNGLPSGAKAVKLWDDRDEAWTNVVEGIAARVNRLELRRPAPKQAPVSMSLETASLPSIDGHKAFSVDVLASKIPEGGYIGWQTIIDYGSLVYAPPDDKSEFLWPDANLAVALRSFTGITVSHGVLTSLLPPLPVSNYTGTLLRMTLRCPEASTSDKHSHTIKLIGLNETEKSGAAFMQEAGTVPIEAVQEEEVPGYRTLSIVGSVDVHCDPGSSALKD